VLDGRAEWHGQPERQLGGVTLAARTPRWRWGATSGTLVDSEAARSS
jgi:hypothetical protein